MRGKPSKPHRELWLPESIWEQAEQQAERSTLRRFRTGAILVDGQRVVGRGCSHITSRKLARQSVHAEQHALSGVYDTDGLTCVIVTLNRSGNWAWSSKPCAFCTHLMYNAGIERVIYGERDNTGSWTINAEDLESLIKRASVADICAEYAKSMRVG